jgi:translocation and assembly module TamB
VRKILYRLLIILLLVVLVFIATSVWLLGTSGGARFLLAIIARHYSVALDIENVNGKLWDDLRLEGLHVSREDISLEAETLVLRWQPVKLLTKNNLLIDQFEITGRDVSVSAEGDLNKKISYTVDIKDLSGIIQDARGSLHSEGWIRMTDGNYEGDVYLKSKNVHLYGVSFDHATLAGSLQRDKGYPVSVKAAIDNFQYSVFKVESAQLDVNGTIKEHTIEARFSSAQSFVQCLLTGEYKSGTWDGLISRFEGNDDIGRWGLESPATIKVSQDIFIIDQLALNGVKGEQLALDVTLHHDKETGTFKGAWEKISLIRMNQWLKDIHISGSTSGTIDATWERKDIQHLLGKLTFAGTLSGPFSDIRIETTDLKFEGGPQGLSSSLDIKLLDGGNLGVHLNSPSPARFTVPEKGEFKVLWQNITLSFMRPLFPEGINMKGELNGHLEGKIFPQNHLDITGKTVLSNGVLTYTHQGLVAAELQTAEVSWIWRDTKLSVELSLALAGQGNIRGSATFPLPAAFPASVDKEGTIKGSLQGNVTEKGLLSAVFPGLMRESSGKLALDVHVGGTWSRPNLQGYLQLANAGAYLPSAGIRIDDVQADVRFNRDRILLESLHAQSGNGSLSGDGEFHIEGWKISDFRAHISGDHFQTIYLPELQVTSSPKLLFNGTQHKLSVSGEIHVPELIVSSQEQTESVKPSKDVVFIDSQETEQKDQPLTGEMNVHVVFGNRVFVRAAGADAQLGGDVQIVSKDLSEINGKGLITVLKGHYRRYGVNLDIKRGRVVFTGGAIDSPVLDILALRKIGDIRAGVLITGTPRSPIITLYSEPPMPDADILAYIVLGHPLGDNKKDADLVFKAASILASSSESTALQEQLKQRTGLDVLDIESGNGELSRSMLTIGKYLSPKLYISFGKALFGEGTLFRMRYTLSKHWEIETQSGTESGLDFYYKLDFK